MTTPDSTPIADRVRFWEERDKINQELIPRVIRQHELLTAHIADHDNLPLVAGNAISEALAEAREEQQRHYDAALEVAKQEQQQQYKGLGMKKARSKTGLGYLYRPCCR